MTKWTDGDVEEYKSFVDSVCQFVNTNMNLLGKQKQCNIIFNQELTRHLEIASIQQELIRDMGKQLIAYKALLTEHEVRIINLEKEVKGGYLPSLATPDKKPN